MNTIKKLLTGLMLSILLLTCTNAKSAQFEDINILGISFNYDGLFKDSTAEYGGLLAPLNETQTNINNIEEEGMSNLEIFSYIAVIAVIVIAVDSSDCTLPCE